MAYPALLLLLSLRLLLSLPAVGGGTSVSAAAVAPPAARCARTCGGVDIPYPFGVGEDCAMGRGYRIRCEAVNGTLRPFSGMFEVTRISVPDSKVWIRMNISWLCYDAEARQHVSEFLQNFTNSPFRFSSPDNRFFVIGCDTLAYIKSMPYITGCMPTCSGEQPKNGSCSGAGCCEVEVPKGLAILRTNLKNTAEPSRGSCSYLVLMEKATFNFSTTYLSSTVFWDEFQGRVPVVLDWAIRRHTCYGARKLGVYACASDHSECENATAGPGYRCKCSSGYQGNPYVKDGCEDINECHDNTTYPCAGKCHNTQGSYSCSCPPGREAINGACIANNKSTWVIPVVCASVGLVVLVTTIGCAYLIIEGRKLQHIRHRYFRRHGGLLLLEEIKSRQGTAFKIFSEAELQEATDKFSEERVLGRGGHGIVYKGLLKGNVEVAIKRCMSIDEQYKKEFGKEMLILSQINHKNIVKLLGCCIEVEVPMLVYEFVPNGTLFHFIHSSNGRHISLATRLQIAHESAEALAYLHTSASPPILHGDVKSSNILLTCDCTVKVSDFGASTLAPTDEAQFVTLVQGTCGYLDPEYMQTCQLTDKSDVYSFGVVLLELLTCKKPFNLEAPEDEKSLAIMFISMTNKDKLEEILDDQIKNDDNKEVLEETAKLAKQCLDICGVKRPSMKEVSERLDRLKQLMQ
ncbi:hypothetical protein ACP4OV_011286 [Aristida adscensionis]